MTRDDLLRQASENRHRAQRIRKLAGDMMRDTDHAAFLQLAEEKEREAARLEEEARRIATERDRL
jgi:hypothetical protein